MILDITDYNFESIVLNNSKPIILDFWAPRCGPCKTLIPHLENLAVEYGKKVTIGKVNIDMNSELAIKFGIRSIPTILYLKDRAVLNKHIGATSKKILEEKLINTLFDN